MRQAEHTEEGIFMPDKDPGINRFSREERAKLLHIKNGYSTRLRTGSVLYPCHYRNGA
jgi:hypothetical protein